MLLSQVVAGLVFVKTYKLLSIMVFTHMYKHLIIQYLHSINLDINVQTLIELFISISIGMFVYEKVTRNRRNKIF